MAIFTINKVVYIALYLIGADFLLMNYFRIFHYIIKCLSFKQLRKWFNYIMIKDTLDN